jgi:hypothetical protein
VITWKRRGKADWSLKWQMAVSKKIVAFAMKKVKGNLRKRELFIKVVIAWQRIIG